MELSLTVLNQVLVMFVLMLIGYITFKVKLADNTGIQQMTNILLYIVSPLVIIDAYQMKYDELLAKNLLIAFLLGIISHFVAISVAYIFIRKKGNEKNKTIERFSIIYSNCGFMALPLLSALFGSEGVFYASAYMIVFNILTWTHGYIIMCKAGNQSENSKISLKSILASPVLISVAVGLIIFFFKIPIPSVFKTSFSFIASLNTPLAMLVTGITLAQADIFSAFKKLRFYYVVLLGCVVVPLFSMAIYFFLPISPTLILVNLVSTACPCAVTTILFSTKFGLDSGYASKLLTLSNIISIATIPAIVFIYQTISPLIK